MAVITGFLAETGERRGGYDSDPYITGDLREYSGLQYPPVGQVVGDINSPALISALPVSAAPRTIGAFFQQAYSDDYYNRVHVIPSSLVLGNVITDRSIPVTIWNAHFSSRTLNNAEIQGDPGILVTGASFPFGMFPLRELVLSVDVSRTGPPSIDASLALAFATPADSRTVVLAGSRITAWTFRPDWSRPVVERLEWLTDVITSYNGTEQRIALRQLPRRSFEFDYCVDTPASRRRLDLMMYAGGAKAWALPVWTDGSILSSGIAAGVTSIAVTTTNMDYHASGLAIVISDFDRFEVVEVESVGATSINLVEPTVNAWSSGAKIYPARVGFLDDAVKIARFTGDCAYGVVRFRLTDDSIAISASEIEYRGYPVLTHAPVWSRDLTTDYRRKIEVIDFGVGAFTHHDESGMPFTVQSHHWMHTNRLEVEQFRQFLYARRGKARALWVPTFIADLLVVSNVASGDAFIDVENHGYALHLAQAENRRDIRIKLRSGTIYYRRIVASIEVSSSVERLTIDASIPTAVAAADIELVSFMAFARMDSDAAEISWWTESAADSTLNFRSVRNGV